MITLDHIDGSTLTLDASAEHIVLGLKGPLASAASPINLTLAETERLQKHLGTLCAQLRVHAARVVT